MVTVRGYATENYTSFEDYQNVLWHDEKLSLETENWCSCSELQGVRISEGHFILRAIGKWSFAKEPKMIPKNQNHRRAKKATVRHRSSKKDKLKLPTF